MNREHPEIFHPASPKVKILHRQSTMSKPRNRHWYHLPSTQVSPVLYALILCVYFCAMLSLIQIHVTIITINIHNCFISTRLPPALPIITISTPLLLNPGNCSSVLHNFVTSRILNKQNHIVCDLLRLSFFIQHKSLDIHPCYYVYQ